MVTLISRYKRGTHKRKKRESSFKKNIREKQKENKEKEGFEGYNKGFKEKKKERS